MAWIELHQGLREHKKVFACADLLGISRVTMVGTLASIWLWALDNAQDGSLEGVSNRTIARICDWKENKADLLVGALVETGWLDQNENGLEIHDWVDYAGKLMDRREKDRERKRNAGVRKNSAGIPAEGMRNSCATVPNRTVPNRTVPKKECLQNDVCTDAFDLFWSAYPRKVNKQGAWKAFQKVTVSVDVLLAALESHKKSSQWVKDGGSFIPHPTTWLNQKRWEEELVPDKTTPKGASGNLGTAELEAIQKLLKEG